MSTQRPGCGRLTVFLLSCAGLPAQASPLQPAFHALLRDGTSVEASAVELRGGEQLELRAASGARQVGLGQLVALQGAAVAIHTLPSFELQGGDVVRGLLAAGDKGGEWVEVQSPVLGLLRLPVDRLACVRLRPEVAAAEELRLPDGVTEALFLKAAIGFDVVAGTLHQFGRDGVFFQRDGDAQPKWYRSDDLVGVRFREPAARADAPDCELLTRTGDRLAVALHSWHDGRLACRREGDKPLELRDADLACLTVTGRGLLHLSALTPAAVDERGFDGDVLLPWQRDRSVTGGPLLVNGRGASRGLGVHSRSRLTFTVPPGCDTFTGRVGIDDAALALPPRAHVEVQVLVDDAAVFSATLAAGDPVRDLGHLPVRPGQRLGLLVDFGKGRDLADRVDWLLPVFVPAKAP